jgi:hypothetical protein
MEQAAKDFGTNRQYVLIKKKGAIRQSPPTSNYRKDVHPMCTVLISANRIKIFSEKF